MTERIVLRNHQNHTTHLRIKHAEVCFYCLVSFPRRRESGFLEKIKGLDPFVKPESLSSTPNQVEGKL